MIGMDSYLNAYVDRRMKYIVEEYDLSTRNDLVDFTRGRGCDLSNGGGSRFGPDST